jgi:hypothetical protein
VTTIGPRLLAEVPEGKVCVKRGERAEQTKHLSMHIETDKHSKHGDTSAWDIVGFLRLQGTKALSDYKLRMHDNKEEEHTQSYDWLAVISRSIIQIYNRVIPARGATLSPKYVY